MRRDPTDEVFGPIVLPGAVAPSDPVVAEPDPAVREIQARLRGETKAYQTSVGKRQFRG